MPELPEVETIRLGLQKYLLGSTVTDIEVRLPKMVSGEVAKVKGAKVLGVRRFGKGLVIDLDNDLSITIHVKMTGQLIYEGSQLSPKRTLSPTVGGTLPNQFTHVIFKLKETGGDAHLYYNDIRQFGWIKIIETAQLSEQSYFKELGPEPLKDLTLEKFSDILKKKKTPIKPLLMDQKVIAGVGNIYANDALYAAKIHPTRKTNTLTEGEIATLLKELEKVLRKGIEVGGASEWQYVNATGEKGGYQNFFQVYGKVGKECQRCRTKVEKTVMGGRGTFFCPTCQV